MGNNTSWMGSGKQEIKVILLGLTRCGKTSLFERFKTDGRIQRAQVVKEGVEEVQYKGVTFTVWDLGVVEGLKQIWRNHYQHAEAIIFVVDSTDVGKMELAGEELHDLLSDKELKDVAVVVLANKQDDPKALSPEEVKKHMGIHNLSEEAAPFKITLLPSSCKTGQGILEGLDWLISALYNELHEIPVVPLL